MRAFFVGWAFPIVGVAVLIGLLFHPPAGWLVRAQLKAQIVRPNWLIAFPCRRHVSGPLPGDSDAAEQESLRTLTAAAATAPHDYALQLTRAVTASDRAEKVEPLRALQSVFPNRPALIAHTLLLASRCEVRIFLAEDFAGTVIPARLTPDPAAVLAFERDAAEGERLDPDNAFFPLMRAFAYTAVKRESAALAEIHRAATLPRFDDYCTEGSWAALNAYERLYGRTSEILRMSVQESVIHPHYTDLVRAAARQALECEKAGRAEDAWAIRRDLVRCGAIIRSQSRTTSGSVSGLSIVTYATARSCETPSIVSSRGRQEVDAARSAYCEYLARTGHAERVQAIHAEFAADDQVRSIFRNGAWYADNSARAEALSRRWLADLLILANALGLLLLGVAAAALVRLRLDRGPLAALIIGASLLAIAFMTAIPAWCALFTGFSQRSSIHNPTDASSPGSDLAYLLGIPPTTPTTVRSAALLIVLLGPVIALLWAAVVCVARKDLSLAAFVRRLAAAGLTTGSVFLLIYAAIAVRTLPAEAELRAVLDRQTVHEGAYCARLVGKTWPP